MDYDLLQPRAIVPVILRLPLESVARGTYAKHAPVLLEQTEIGGIISLSVAVGVVGGVHGFASQVNKSQMDERDEPILILHFEHGDGKIECISTGIQDGSLMGADARHDLGATIISLAEVLRDGRTQSSKKECRKKGQK